MGSSGTGNFSDYTGTKADRPGGPGGASGEDPCHITFDAFLEDIERCPYYKKYKRVPEAGSGVSVLLFKRLNVVDGDGILIGYLPTQFNFLAGCIKSGEKYSGVVTTSTPKPIPTVSVNLSYS